MLYAMFALVQVGSGWQGLLAAAGVCHIHTVCSHLTRTAFLQVQLQQHSCRLYSSSSNLPVAHMHQQHTVASAEVNV